MAWYVGKTQMGRREIFSSGRIPTEDSHGKRFRSAEGPFKSMRGAEEFARVWNAGGQITQEQVNERHPRLRRTSRDPMTREQRARYYGDQVGRQQPAGRRLSPGSHERVEWQKDQLCSVLAREGLFDADLYRIAEGALIDRALKQTQKMHSENYRQAYGSTTTRKPSSRRLSGESNAEYAGRLRSLDRFTEDEIYEKAYRRR